MIRIDEFLSEIYDKKWGKYTGSEYERETVLAALSEGSYDRIDFEISSENFDVIFLLISHGCFLTSSKVYYEKNRGSGTPSSDEGSAFSLSAAQRNDADELAEIAVEAFALDRYRNDPYLEKGKIHDLYSGWLANNLNYRCKETVICRLAGEIVGFLCVIEEEKRYYFELIGVKSKYGGKGIGSLMFHHALSKYGDKQCMCVTQFHNVPMQKLLQKEGFRIYKAAYIFTRDYMK